MRSTLVFHSVLWGALIVAPVAAFAQGQSFAGGAEPAAFEGISAAPTTPTASAQDKGPYWDGMRAINDGHWADAETIFSRNIKQKGEHPDGSLYWKAYAQNKLGHGKNALDTCGELGRGFPSSKWIHECSALEIEVRANLGHPVEPQAESDDDLKLLALDWMMLTNEPRALADLQEILSGDASERLKQKAQVILGQHYSDATYAEIVRIRYVEGDVRIARGEQNEKPAGEAWEQAVADLPLETGFSLTTGDKGRVEIELEDASTIYLGENSVLTFNDLHTTSGVPYTEVALLSGALSLAVNSTIYGEAFVLRTPTDDFAVRYPHRAYVRINSYTDAMALTSRDTSGLDLTGVEPKQVPIGQTLTLQEGHPIDAPSTDDSGAFAEFDKWVADRMAQRAAAMTDVMKAAGLTSPLPGLADMKGQGTFFPCPPYGTCWEPAEDSQQTTARDSATPFPTGRQSAHVMNVNFEVPRFAAAQLMPLGSPDPWSVPLLDAFSPCIPISIRYRVVKDPITGNARVIDSGLGGSTRPWDWAVCHAGGWVHVQRHHHYVWCAGEKRHHLPPVQWVRSEHKVGFVPIHPFDVKGRPPINRKEEVYAINNKNGLSLERVKFDPSHPIDVLKSPPHEFRTTYLRPLAKADVPHMEAHAIKAPLTVAKGPIAKGPASGPVARPVNIPIRFDSKSQSFMMSKEVMHGGKSTTVSAPISNRGGTLQARGGSFAGGHGGPSGAGGSHGGGSAGSAGGGHGGGGSGSSGGGSHGGGGGSSGGSSSSGSSGGGSASGGGSHR
jgi:hypothetical protein